MKTKMAQAAMQKILAALTPAEYLQTVGQQAANPFHTFTSRKLARPAEGGRAIMPPARASEIWAEKMAGLPLKQEKRAAYIHIPFCSRLCLYCGFFQNYSNEEQETLYVEHLIKEMQAAKEQLYLKNSLIHTVFLGGGTPSALSPANISKVLQTVKECLPLANDCEITLEGRINDLVAEKMEAWFAYGVNRLSLGVQSFDTRLRQRMGRVDPQEVVIERLHQLCAYNQAAVIIDLIYGLPGQSKESFLKDLQLIDQLPIDGMDLYQLQVFENGALAKAMANGQIPPAGSVFAQAEMFAAAAGWLEERAYQRLSNCHWAKNNRERSMYNLLVKSGGEIFPFGCGAGGNFANLSVMLERDLPKYLAAVAQGIKPVLFAAEKPAGREFQHAINAQLEIGHLNLTALVQKYGDFLAGLEVLLDLWVERGLMTKGPVLYKLTRAGEFWLKNLGQIIAACSLALLQECRQDSA